MIKDLHIASQYLTAAAISFVEKKDDDSHTNLAWSNKTSTLFSRPLNSNGDQLGLNLNYFSLEWHQDNVVKASLPLSERKHVAVLEWLSSLINSSGFSSAYEYSFHYDIGYDEDMSAYEFPKAEQNELGRIAALLDIAQNAMTSTLEEQKLSSEIRVWSHHFDMGAFAVVNDQLALGFGLAIPDGNIADFYYYITGYQGENALETKSFQALSLGTWQTESWKAGTLEATGIDEEKARLFLKETINAYRKVYA